MVTIPLSPGSKPNEEGRESGLFYCAVSWPFFLGHDWQISSPLLSFVKAKNGQEQSLGIYEFGETSASASALATRSTIAALCEGRNNASCMWLQQISTR